MANLRTELALTICLARKSKFDYLKSHAAIRQIVADCPSDIREQAINLSHQITNQIQKIQGNHFRREIGVASVSVKSIDVRRAICK